MNSNAAITALTRPRSRAGDLFGLDAPAAPPRQVAGGEHGGQAGESERSRLSSTPIARRFAGTRRAPDPSARLQELAHQRASRGSTPWRPAIEALDEARAGVVQFGKVGSEVRVVELAAVEPRVEPPQRASVGAAGILADGGLDQAARGRLRPADHGLLGVEPRSLRRRRFAAREGS